MEFLFLYGFCYMFLQEPAMSEIETLKSKRLYNAVRSTQNSFQVDQFIEFSKSA